MKPALLLFFLGAAVASELRWTLHEQVKDVSDKQHDVNALLTGLGSEDAYNYVPKEFPYSDTKYYRIPEAVEKFLSAWNEGFITKDSVFSLYSYKNRHDTYRLFDIFYYAKDYDTFIKIAKWARSELHPLQFTYAFTAALIHRKDTTGIAIPHFYEVLPHYFIPSDIVQGAYKANILGVSSRKFDVNTTGHEYSWYKGQTMESYKSGPKWNPYDAETRMSYYTEDVGLADTTIKTMVAYAPWISDEKYPDIRLDRHGEILFDVYKYLLRRYNLERYGNDLPPVEPLVFEMPIKTGYNSHLVSLHGHPFTPRPDGLVPYLSNPEGIDRLTLTKKRYDDLTDLLGYWNPVTGKMEYLEDGNKGLNTLGCLVYGGSHPAVRAIYKPFHYQAFEALDTAVRASNNIGTSGSVLSNYLTEMRDPVYYRVLATIQQVFWNYFTKLQPYTPQELGFPGVKLVDFQTSKLETYFENHEYDITNSVPVRGKGRNSGYEYTVSRTRISHKPFTFKMTIHSDKDQDAFIRVFLTPVYDSNRRELGLAEKVEQAVGMFVYHLKLKKGVNPISGHSSQGLFTEEKSLKAINHELKTNKSSSQPFYEPKVARCAFPNNLMLPRGSKGGKQYTVFAIVTPYTPTSDEVHGPCNYDLLYSDDKPADFPTNRRAVPSAFEVDNILFKDVTIYHTGEYF